MWTRRPPRSHEFVCVPGSLHGGASSKGVNATIAYEIGAMVEPFAILPDVTVCLEGDRFAHCDILLFPPCSRDCHVTWK